MSKLLTRDQFREAVFARDGHLCVICGAEAKDAHHIIERRLWPDGGYYLDNGASVCADCHWDCESTDVSVEEVRQAARITRKILPPNIYDDAYIDKWGNDISAHNYRQRYPGPLADDESVKKAIKEACEPIEFVKHRKYPRTPHLPSSPGLVGQEYTNKFDFGSAVIVTEKMDGENTTLYSDKTHARSIDSRHTQDRDMAKAFWAERCGDIPQDMRICGEYLYAKHSIHYKNLPSVFMGISIWEGSNCLSWPETQEWFEMLDIVSVPVIGQINIEPDMDFGELEIVAHKMWMKDHTKGQGVKVSEGFVIRSVDGFSAKEFDSKVGKWVRPNHIDSSRHWRHEKVTPNEFI